MKYDAILIDALNLLHRLKDQKSDPSLVSSKYVYKNLVIRYITFVTSLQEQYLADGGTVYFLLDHSPNKHDYSKTYRNIGRKAISSKYKEGRAKESKEFYNSFDLIKYYYLANRPHYRTIQAQHLEADDLVKPVLEHYVKRGERSLLVTNDYDWTRYISEQVDWLPSLRDAPATVQDFIDDKGYKPTEESVTLYKAVFGDRSDGIDHLATENQANVAEMKELLAKNPTRQDFIGASHQSTRLKESEIFKAIHDNENQFRINLQLIDAIEVPENLLRSITCIGRNSQVVIDAVETAIGLRKEEEREFVFGNIKA